jgi:hypothetical protein
MKAEARSPALGEFAIAVKNAMSRRRHRSAPVRGGDRHGHGDPVRWRLRGPARSRRRHRTRHVRVRRRSSAASMRAPSPATPSPTTSSTRPAAPRPASGGVLGYWVDQGTAPTASQPKLARVEMKLRKVGALGYMTDELVSDAAALGGELQSMFARGTDVPGRRRDRGRHRRRTAARLHGRRPACLDREGNRTRPRRRSTPPTCRRCGHACPRGRRATRSGSSTWTRSPQLDFLTIPGRHRRAGAALRELRAGRDPDDQGSAGRPVEYCATLGTVGDIALVDLSKYRLIRKGGVEQASSIHVLGSPRAADVPRVLPLRRSADAARRDHAVQGHQHAVAVHRARDPQLREKQHEPCSESLAYVTLFEPKSTRPPARCQRCGEPRAVQQLHRVHLLRRHHR